VEGEKQSSAKKWLWFPVVFVIAILAIVFWPKSIDDFEVYEVPIGNHTFPKEAVDSTYMEVAAVNSATHEEPIEAPKTKKAELTGKINGYEYVDLGLNVKWATCNVGASSPSDFGNYYAWGETTTTSDYSSSNSKTYGKSINDIKGNSQYDAARANWGGDWRMPTKEEMQELIDKCTWTWTKQNGVNGFKVTSKVNSNYIFLPVAGCRGGSSLRNAGSYGGYWSSTPFESSSNLAYYLDFNSSNHYMYHYYRYFGQSVRPVIE
jgi:uncharacterized protein (TIGR02145 family)